MTLQHRERGLLESSDRFPPCFGSGCAILDGAGVQIFEICHELVDRGVGKIDAGLRNMTTDFVARIK